MIKYKTLLSNHWISSTIDNPSYCILLHTTYFLKKKSQNHSEKESKYIAIEDIEDFNTI